MDCEACLAAVEMSVCVSMPAGIGHVSTCHIFWLYLILNQGTPLSANCGDRKTRHQYRFQEEDREWWVESKSLGTVIST